MLLVLGSLLAAMWGHRISRELLTMGPAVLWSLQTPRLGMVG